MKYDSELFELSDYFKTVNKHEKDSKDIEIKKRIKDISYELLELVYRANLLEEPKEKKNLLIKAIAKVKIIDFLINLSYDRELLPQKRYIKLSEKLDDIVKYISGLLKTYNKQQ